jgi:hypothetical protein
MKIGSIQIGNPFYLHAKFEADLTTWWRGENREKGYIVIFDEVEAK